VLFIGYIIYFMLFFGFAMIQQDLGAFRLILFHDRGTSAPPAFKPDINVTE